MIKDILHLYVVPFTHPPCFDITINVFREIKYQIIPSNTMFIEDLKIFIKVVTI